MEMGLVSMAHEHQPLLSQQAGIDADVMNNVDYGDRTGGTADCTGKEESIGKQVMQQQQPQQCKGAQDDSSAGQGSTVSAVSAVETAATAVTAADVDVSSMTVREQLAYLWATIRQPGILHPTLFIFLWQISPSSESAMFFFT